MVLVIVIIAGHMISDQSADALKTMPGMSIAYKHPALRAHSAWLGYR